MLNQTVLVGRLTRDPELRELEDGKKVCNITIAVPRSYKNEKGEYDADFIDCTLWEAVASNTTEYCHKGDMVGVKGSLRSDTYEKDGESHKTMSFVVDKVTFLASSKKHEEETEQEDEMEV